MPDLHIRFETDENEPVAPTPPPDESTALEMLAAADFTAEQLVPWGSNYTFAVALTAPDDHDFIGIYKPRAGERPLWDFPSGTLYIREYASYLLSRWLGWHFVPPTVIREGPHGIGSLQLYVEPSSEEIDPRRFWARKTPEIERMVLFDHIANNADRKIGHCLVDCGGRVWGIDHGLTFNEDPKLRTVLWQYAGDEISGDLMPDLRRLATAEGGIYDELGEMLHRRELDALRGRAARLVETGRFPLLDPHYNIPYGWW